MESIKSLLENTKKRMKNSSQNLKNQSLEGVWGQLGSDFGKKNLSKAALADLGWPIWAGL